MAIRPIKEADRIWAKTGTANIIRQKCLAWEFNKSCMVCDEVCPYDAIEFLNEKGKTVPVPHVLEDKCAGGADTANISARFKTKRQL